MPDVCSGNFRIRSFSFIFFMNVKIWVGSNAKILFNFPFDGDNLLLDLGTVSVQHVCCCCTYDHSTWYYCVIQSRTLQCSVWLYMSVIIKCGKNLKTASKSHGKGKGKAVPLQAWSGPEGSRKLRFPDFMTTAQDGGKVVSLMDRPPLTPGNTPGTHFC